MNEDEGSISVGHAEGRKIEMQLVRNGRHIVTFMLRDDELATHVPRFRHRRRGDSSVLRGRRRGSAIARTSSIGNAKNVMVQ